jgi:hypothetical protein
MSAVSPDALDSFLAHGGGYHFGVWYLSYVG